MTSPTTVRPRAPHLVAALLLAGIATLAGAGPASADAYRFWGYYQLKDGGWDFAQKGPGDSTPADGSVQGWRFAVADASSTRTPRVVPTFEQLCSTTPAAAGSKRVGIVIDYGRRSDGPDGSTEPPAPRGKCVSVPTDATGADVLAATTLALRLAKGLTCAIGDWPTTGCGEPVARVPAVAAAPDTATTLDTDTTTATTTTAAGRSADDGPGAPVDVAVGLGAVVLVLTVLGLLAYRRRGELRG